MSQPKNGMIYFTLNCGFSEVVSETSLNNLYREGKKQKKKSFLKQVHSQKTIEAE